MEPYYTQAEQLYQVHGARGEDPTEPPSSAPYPFPAVSHEPRIQQLSDDLAAAGLHPFHAPCGVLLDEANMPYSPCVRCQNCDGFPCLVHAKSDAEVIGVRPALEHANVTLLTQRARPFALQTDPAGTTVTGSCVERDGAQRDASRATSSSSRAARRTRRSCCSRRPTTRTRTAWRTAPTRSGATTCSTTARPCSRSRKEPNPTVFQKTLGRQRLLLRERRLRVPDGQHPDGRQVAGADVPRREAGRDEARAAWTLRDVARHAVDFWLSTEDLPRPENRVTLARDGGSSARYTQTNDAAKKRLYQQLKSMLAHLGMHHDHLLPRHAYLKNEIPVAGVAHQAGTCRFGNDPATSVLNADCRAHEVDNLYVVDTSFFPSIGAVNPALTAMANALRVGDHLLERLGAGASRPEVTHAGGTTS